MSKTFRRVAVTSTLMMFFCVPMPALAADDVRLDGELQPFLDGPKFDMQPLFEGERFPNVVVARDGTVLATWGSKQVRVRRSDGGGKTWGPEIAIGDGIHGGGVIVDERRSDVLVFTHPEHPPRDGQTAPRTVYRSSDHGKTWQVAKATFHKDAEGFVPSLHMMEHGTTLVRGPHTGRLIRPARVYRTSPERYATNIYSDDGGRHWHAGKPFAEMGTGEAALVELSDGRLLGTARKSFFAEDEPLRDERVFAYSDDGGVTWNDAFHAESIPDGPRYRGTDRRGANYNGHFGMFNGLARLPVAGRDILLYSNADHDGHERVRMTVWASFDGGKTWPVKRLVNEGPSGYSSLAAGRAGTASEGWIYLQFEHGEGEQQYAGCQIARFNLAWLLAGESTGDGPLPDWVSAAEEPALLRPPQVFTKHDLLAGEPSETAQESGAASETGNAPLAEMPSPPGPHIAKIAALGNNEWLALGAPEGDPRWGNARGRSWSSNQPVASNLGGMFVFAEGVHAFVKPDQHYMNDLWFYDINAHRWICLYPGIDTRTIADDIRSKELTVNDDGVLVDKDGEPLPPLLIHAYGYLGYDPERKKFLTFGSQFGNYFTTGEGGVFEEANRLFQEQRRGKRTGPLSPFFYDVASGRWEVFPVNRTPGRRPYGANLLVYVASKKQFWYGGSDGAWYFDQEQRRWNDAAPKGTPPTGIDHCAAYDPKRNRIYYYQRDGEGATDNFLIYDVSKNEWTKPEPAGSAPRAATSNNSIFQFDTVNDRLVIIRWSAGQDEERAVYSYAPEANAWADPLPLPEEVRGSIKNGSHGCYDSETNAFYCHFASDSRDNGTIWVYRFKR